MSPELTLRVKRLTWMTVKFKQMCPWYSPLRSISVLCIAMFSLIPKQENSNNAEYMLGKGKIILCMYIKTWNYFSMHFFLPFHLPWYIQSSLWSFHLSHSHTKTWHPEVSMFNNKSTPTYCQIQQTHDMLKCENATSCEECLIRVL